MLTCERGCAAIPLNRPRIRETYQVTGQDIQTLVSLLLLHGEGVTPAKPIRPCPDPKDHKSLEVAVTGKAGVLVSGDQDLLRLHPDAGIPIVPPHECYAAQVSLQIQHLVL